MFECISLTGSETKTHEHLTNAAQMLTNQLLQKYQKIDYTIDLVNFFLQSAERATAGDIRETKSLRNTVVLNGMSNFSVLDRKVYVQPKAENLSEEVAAILEERGILPKKRRKKK